MSDELETPSQNFELERLRLRYSLIKVIVSAVLGSGLTAFLGYVISQQEVDIEKARSSSELRHSEEENLKAYFKYTMEGDVYDRLKLSMFFSHVLEDPKARARWAEYNEELRRLLEQYATISGEALDLEEKLKTAEGPKRTALLLAKSLADERRLRIEELLSPAQVKIALTSERDAPAPPPDAADSDTPRPIAEAKLVALLPAFAKARFSARNSRYPFALPGISVPVVGPGEAPLLNSSTMTEALLVGAWSQHYGRNFHWGRDRHRDAMVMRAEAPFSPVTAIIESGMGLEAPVDALPEAWTFGHAWRALDPPRAGFSFIVVDSDGATGKVLTLEATNLWGLNGVGFRGVGELAKLEGFSPGADWAQKPEVWTWERYRQHYPHMRLAKLHVDAVRWLSKDSTPE